MTLVRSFGIAGNPGSLIRCTRCRPKSRIRLRLGGTSVRIDSPRLEWAYATDAVGSETPLLWGLLVCHHRRYTVVFHADFPLIGPTNVDPYAVAIECPSTPFRDSRCLVAPMTGPKRYSECIELLPHSKRILIVSLNLLGCSVASRNGPRARKTSSERWVSRRYDRSLEYALYSTLHSSSLFAKDITSPRKTYLVFRHSPL